MLKVLDMVVRDDSLLFLDEDIIKSPFVTRSVSNAVGIFSALGNITILGFSLDFRCLS